MYLTKKGQRHTKRKLKKPTKYEPNYNTKKYTEGTINITMEHIKEHEPMKDCTIQEQVKHTLGVGMTQVYSLKKGLK
jgi:hypothetical protein